MTTAEQYIVHRVDDQGREWVQVYIPWADVTAVLGHPHRGEPEDDAALIAWLRDHGAPAWIEEAEGWIDEGGWGLYGPEEG